VLAIDSSEALVRRLTTHAEGLPIKAVRGDLADFGKQRVGKPALIACMGDTLTHLECADQVRRLLSKCAFRLRSGGSLVLGLRDYSRPLAGADRFLHVRADDHRILTCALEYEPERVIVTDILHERRQGCWSMRASSYAKLRIGIGWLKETLASLGFELASETVSGGMVLIRAEIPAP
jgi:hypothetical protein